MVFCVFVFQCPSKSGDGVRDGYWDSRDGHYSCRDGMKMGTMLENSCGDGEGMIIARTVDYGVRCSSPCDSLWQLTCLYNIMSKLNFNECTTINAFFGPYSRITTASWYQIHQRNQLITVTVISLVTVYWPLPFISNHCVLHIKIRTWHSRLRHSHFVIHTFFYSINLILS